ncbi:putative capsid [uncultured virus]|uniref:Putative capsid n=1 Tax=uncultured virus TaxID=340016 RepID=A0A2K9LSW0_9VIRU|nr:putative capsid [uncultured virus]
MEDLIAKYDPPIPHYFKFRYDISSDRSETVRDVIDVLTESKFFPGTASLEHHNALGEVIKTHIHYHFRMEFRPSHLQKVKDRMVYVLKKHFGDKRLKGWYSLKFEPDVKDTFRFFSYVMKQQDGKYQQPEYLPLPTPDYDVVHASIVASEEYARNKEFLCAKREKEYRKTTTYERMLELYDKTKPPINCKYDACEFVYQFFTDEGFPPNRTKIREMVDGLLLKTGVMSKREFFDSL